MRASGAPGASNPAEKRSEDATEVLSPRERLEGAGRPPSFERSRIGDYVIESIVGEGGGGTVFAARHPEHGRRVAIKVLRSEMVPLPHLVTRFNREVEAINKIDHPNIVEVFEWGETERGQPYYVMELLEGHNLRERLQLQGRFSPTEALQLFEPICAALQAAHDAGFVHRDIKGSNIIVVDSDEGRSVKLLDFGIAKMVHGEMQGQGVTEPGARLGSAHTMAPEQVRCERLDARADVYALGVVLYQLLTGEYPFDAEDQRQVAFMHLSTPAPRPSTRAPVSPALDAVVLRCLEKQAERRYGSVTELLAGLRAAAGEPLPAAPEQELRALGIYVQIPISPDADLDDAMIEDVSFVLDVVEQYYGDRGYELPLRTSFAMLGVRILSANATQTPAEASEILADLQSLFAERPAPHPDVRIEVSVRVDVVHCREPFEIIGGALLDLSAWTNEHRLA